jgi:hypothetical protein
MQAPVLKRLSPTLCWALTLTTLVLGSTLACSSTPEQGKSPKSAKTTNKNPPKESSDTKASTSGNMDKAVYELTRGLNFMEKAYSEDRTKQRLALFNQAINVFKKAYNLYLNELLVAPEANKDIIEEQVEKINKMLIRCHRDRPAIK